MDESQCIQKLKTNDILDNPKMHPRPPSGKQPHPDDIKRLNFFEFKESMLQPPSVRNAQLSKSQYQSVNYDV